MTVLSSRRAVEPPGLVSAAAVVASCVGFVVIGALQALYGPAIPEIRVKYGVASGVAGLGLSAHFVGALLGVLLFFRLRARFGTRRLLGMSYGLMAAGSLAFAAAHTWPVALTAATVVGLGFGGIDYGLNQLFATGFGRRSTAMLNLLNAHFGIGAVAGPALVGWLGARHYPWLFVALAVLCLFLLPGLRGVRSGDGEAVSTPGSAAAPSRLVPVVAAFIVIYVLHVAIETGVGGWEPTQLAAVGYSASAAAVATSGYWLAMTVGRFLAVPLTLRFPAPLIVTVSCIGMAACLIMAPVAALAPYAYLGVGLFIAPIFPTALPWLSRAAPTVASASAFVIAASMIGGVAFPPLLGAMIDEVGVRAVPALLFGLALVCGMLSVWLRRTTADPAVSRADPPLAAPQPVGGD
ncbi:MFS transporter [Pseudofrankia asymbiotica]|uniref:MFS transporter n=1 Tax=Pseudofrankia asymbiotica TaxID=1834516 RepID=UPI0018E9B250|nr:MFS transporter [Pseudofrankia asymbiotica]